MESFNYERRGCQTVYVPPWTHQSYAATYSSLTALQASRSCDVVRLDCTRALHEHRQPPFLLT